MKEGTMKNDKNKKGNKTNKRHNLILKLKLWFQNDANLKDKTLKPTHIGNQTLRKLKFRYEKNLDTMIMKNHEPKV